MKKTNMNEEYEQLAMDFNDETSANETTDVPKSTKKTKQKDFEIGAAIIVKPEIKRFCDGRGIPDYARNAYIKRFNHGNKTVLIEAEPGGKELGVLLMSHVILV